MTNSNEKLNHCLASTGVSKIVYALVMPETEATINSIFDGVPSGGREKYLNAFREAWTQKQDSVNESFFDHWLEWTRPIVQIDPREFPFRYPNAGASEGLREAIRAYGTQARVERFEPTIHVFEGEYEGYAAYSRAAGISLRTHPRKFWQQALEFTEPTDQWYISQPSGIDGNVWSEFESFASELASLVPTAQIMLDLSCVG